MVGNERKGVAKCHHLNEAICSNTILFVLCTAEESIFLRLRNKAEVTRELHYPRLQLVRTPFLGGRKVLN
jgi:hypothetical protein